MTDADPAFDPTAFAAALAPDRVHLRLLATTDVHLHLRPYDYFTDRPDDSVGLARVAGLVRRMRSGAANTLLLDNGDMLQGNPMADVAAAPHGPGPSPPHPAVAAMNAMGYDAAALGNHDFNFGIAAMLAAYGGADFPVVSANVARRLGATPLEDRPLVPPTALLTRRVQDGGGRGHDLTVGLIGLLPPQITTWDRPHLAGRVDTRDIVETARAHVPALRAAGAQIVIALAHSGIPVDGAADARRGARENAVRELALVPGIDAIIAGHVHQIFPGPEFAARRDPALGPGTVHGVPAVMPGFWGSHLGRIDLALARDGPAWRVTGSAVGVHPIARRGAGGTVHPLVDSDPAVLRATEGAHRATLAHIRRPVGHSDGPLFSYFAQVANDPTVQYVNHAQCAHVGRALAGRPEGALPLLSAAAPFKVGGRGRPGHYIDVPAGALALRHVADLYLHPNTVCALRVSGADLHDWLERSAGQFLTLRPGVSDQPLLDPRFPSYNFDVIDGLSYAVDPTRPPRFDADGGLANPDSRRIAALTHRGQPVDPGQAFIVVTNSFRAAGGGGFSGLDFERVVYAPPLSNRDVVLEQITRERTIVPTANPTWRFVPLPKTSVVIDTGPGALAHLDAIAHLRPEDLGATDQGFRRLRLHL